MSGFFVSFVHETLGLIPRTQHHSCNIPLCGRVGSQPYVMGCLSVYLYIYRICTYTEYTYVNLRLAEALLLKTTD